MSPSLHSLLRRVGWRLRVARTARRSQQMLLGIIVVAIVALLLARLLNLFAVAGWWPHALWLLALPLIMALLQLRPLEEAAIARQIDVAEKTGDLFLNALLVPRGDGFASIVTAQAEERAGTIVLARVVPFRWQRGIAQLLTAALLLAGAGFSVPQLDPLRRQPAREKLAAQERQLAEMQRSTEVRREEIAATGDREPAEVKAALTRLEQTLQQAKPAEKEATLGALAERQKELGELWRQASDPARRASLEAATQAFGTADPKRLESVREQLAKGDISTLQRELEEMREAAKALAAKPNSPENRAARQQLTQRLNELAQTMNQAGGSPQLQQALDRAAAQLDLARNGDLQQQAAEGAADSLALSREELEKLAQSLSDARALEEALKNLQMAKQLAQAGKLDGAELEKLGDPSAYAALFEQKMGEQGGTAGRPEASREAPLGEGPGNGALRPEDDSKASQFKSEKSTGQIAGGKMLLEWKTKEVGQAGARTEDYQSALRSVQQGVAEAIQQEQVPPGYHDAIKRYFDSLPAR